MKKFILCCFPLIWFFTCSSAYACHGKQVTQALHKTCIDFKSKVEQSKRTKHGKNPLSPSKEIDRRLAAFLTLVSSAELSGAETKKTLGSLASDGCLQTLKALSMLSEEQREAQVIDDFLAYYKTHPYKTQQYAKAALSEKLDAFQKIMLTQKGLQFQYAREYIDLVAYELAMLPHLKQFKHTRSIKIESLFEGALPNLKGKRVTFVGSGLPLSGIIVNLLTGAKVNLVEIDKKTTTRMHHFLVVLDQAGIIHRNDFTILLADGQKLAYAKTHQGQHSIKTDILYLAAALPSPVKKNILKQLYMAQNPDLVVIDRYVSGLFKVLYHDKLKNCTIPHFKTLAKLYPQQLKQWKGEKRLDTVKVKFIDQMHQNSSRLLVLDPKT